MLFVYRFNSARKIFWHPPVVHVLIHRNSSFRQGKAYGQEVRQKSPIRQEMWERVGTK